MHFGIPLARLNPRGWLDATRLADELGFESVWMAEHLVLPLEMRGQLIPGEEHPPISPQTPVYDAVAYLCHLAAITERIRLGTFVYLLGIRHPFVGARAFATLDVVSGGRAIVGVGAGWMTTEWDAVGLDPKTRGRRLDEAIDVCRRLWSEDIVEHHGRVYDFGPVMFEPKPVQQPLPVLVGGESDAALRRAVERGDGWLGMQHTPESVAPIAKRLCAERGDAFSISIGGAVRSPDDVERFAEAGVDRIIVAPWSRTSEALDGIKRLADTLF